MRTALIFGTEVRMQGSVMAFMHYADEFGSDFNQDLRVAYSRAEDGAPVAFLLKAAWAMAKGFSGGVPSFEEWATNLGDASLSEIGAWGGWARDVDAAISAEMFREADTGRDERQ